jgi:hypothetical protein
VRRAAGRLPAEEAPIRSAGEATRLAESHISRAGSRAAKVSSQRPFRSKAPGAFADPFTSSRERLAPDSISGIKLREAHGTSRANAVREPKICGFPQLALRASKQWHFPSAGTRYEEASLGVSLSQAKLRKAHGTSRANAVHGRRTQFPSARASDFRKWVFTGRREAAPSGLPPETSRVSTTRRQDVTDQHQQKRANLWLRMLLPKESRKDANSVRHTSCRAIE